MKMMVLVALLAAAGCSKKTSDCDAAIAKGMDNFAATMKAQAPNPQMQESMTTMIGTLKGTLTQRCTDDKWAPEVVSCFTTVAGMKDLQACQAKLTDEQRTKVRNEMRQVMMNTMGSRMPGGPGHPPTLGGSGGPGGPGGANPGSPGSTGAAPAGSVAPPPAGSAAAAPGGAAAAAPGGSAAAAPGGSAAPGGW